MVTCASIYPQNENYSSVQFAVRCDFYDLLALVGLKQYIYVQHVAFQNILTQVGVFDGINFVVNKLKVMKIEGD